MGSVKLKGQVTWRSRLIAARPMGVHLPLAPALAMPSNTTSAVKCIACRHSCANQRHFRELVFGVSNETTADLDRRPAQARCMQKYRFAVAHKPNVATTRDIVHSTGIPVQHGHAPIFPHCGDKFQDEVQTK